MNIGYSPCDGCKYQPNIYIIIFITCLIIASYSFRLYQSKSSLEKGFPIMHSDGINGRGEYGELTYKFYLFMWPVSWIP